MHTSPIAPVASAVDFVEDRLDAPLDLDAVASAVHYSKYHLHRLFACAVGMTLHDYVVRRRLTEAAGLLARTDRPVLEIALQCGYESQQSFTGAFRAMYKSPPAAFRARRAFYPLQWRFSPGETALAGTVSRADVALAGAGDIPAWLELARAAVDGYPCLDEGAYLRALRSAVREGRALVIRDGPRLAGGLAFSRDGGVIDYLAVHPQYRRRGVRRALLAVLREELLPGRTVSMTTYRAGDRADTGWREALAALDFVPGALLVEYGYPTQRFFLPGGSR